MSNSRETPTIVVRRGTETDLGALICLNHGLFSEDSGYRDQFAVVERPGRRTYFEELLANGVTQVV